MKFAVIINDNSTAYHVEQATSSAEAILKVMQQCIKQKIIVNKVVAYYLIEL
jgi:hypothetical protein